MTQPINQENILWRNSIRKGLWHRHTSEIEQISDQYVEIIFEDKHQIARMALREISAVYIMNSHTQGVSNYYGYGTGGHYSRVYGGTSHSNSLHVGDLVFESQTGQRIIFCQIQDPTGVKNLVTAEMHRQKGT
jgi:hypothetical protein